MANMNVKIEREIVIHDETDLGSSAFSSIPLSLERAVLYHHGHQGREKLA